MQKEQETEIEFKEMVTDPDTVTKVSRDVVVRRPRVFNETIPLEEEFSLMEVTSEELGLDDIRNIIM